MKRLLTLLMALAMTASLAACGGTGSSGDTADSGNSGTTAEGGETAGSSGVEDGVLTIAMECAYAPYNWSQSDDSNGAVPISNVPGTYANGYDVMIAKQICEANGWELEVVQSDWDSLVPGVQTGTFDAVIAGQSMTAERSEQVDFAGPYYYASIVCVTKTDSPYANAAGISDLSGGTCTAQIATIWYDSCLPQTEGAKAIGMTHVQTMLHVILPQAIRNILPQIGNNFIINVKDTSVMFIIGFPDFFSAHRAAVGASYLYFPSAVVEMAGYLTMTLIASFLLRWLEKRMDGSSDYKLAQTDHLTMAAGTYSHPDRGTPFDERSKEYRDRVRQELQHGRTRGDR